MCTIRLLEDHVSKRWTVWASIDHIIVVRLTYYKPEEDYDADYDELFDIVEMSDNEESNVVLQVGISWTMLRICN